jgi:hypothetical protein
VKGIAPASIGGTMSENVNITRSGGADYCGSLYEVSPYDARNQVLTSKPRSTFRQDYLRTSRTTTLPTRVTDSGLVTDPSSSSFGQLTSATARTMQITGRFTF